MRLILYKLNTIADEIIPPISLGYLAASAPGHDIMILDGLKEKLTNLGVIKRLKDYQAKIFAIQIFTKDLIASRRLLGEVKESIPGIITVVGGVQPSLMPVETMNFYGNAADYLFCGESERGFPVFLDAVQKGDGWDRSEIPGLVWRETEDKVKVNPGKVIYELDNIVFPRWDLMPPDSYPYAPHGAFIKQYPTAPLITSRGCPFSCNFCSAPSLSNRQIRFRSLDNVFAEIKILHEKFGVKELHIEDDVFSIKKDYVLEFCDRLKATGYNMTWALPNGVRLDSLDEEMLAKMHDTGCHSLNFGIESGDDETLKRVTKKMTTGEIRQKIMMVKKFKFSVGGFFIIGFPWETEGHIVNTIEFAKSLDIDHAGFSYFQPFPGTELTKELALTGEYIINLDHFDASLHTITYLPKGLTENQLRKLRRKALAGFYFRTGIFRKLIKRVASMGHLFYILKRGVRWLSG